MSKDAQIQDRQFFDTFMLILGALVAFSVLVYIVAGSISESTELAYQAEDPAALERIAKRIAPVANVRIAGETYIEPTRPAAAPAPQVPAPADAGMMATASESAAGSDINGKAVYDSACLACHMAGVAGAPKFGDAAVWAPRIDKGLELLYSNAIKGYVGSAGVMPAKGGRADLTDDEVKAAVDYMVDAAKN